MVERFGVQFGNEIIKVRKCGSGTWQLAKMANQNLRNVSSPPFNSSFLELDQAFDIRSVAQF
jgi:hypothetical protein